MVVYGRAWVDWWAQATELITLQMRKNGTRKRQTSKNPNSHVREDLDCKQSLLFSSTVIERLERARGTAAWRMGRKASTLLTPVSCAVVYLARSSLLITKRKERDCMQSREDCMNCLVRKQHSSSFKLSLLRKQS